MRIVFIGPPGAGKTLITKSLPGILPRMNIDEALDVTRIYSVADLLPQEIPLIRNRPFRSPHHTISHAGLVGGGTWPRRCSIGRRMCMGEGDARGIMANEPPLQLSTPVLLSAGRTCEHTSSDMSDDGGNEVVAVELRSCIDIG